MVAVPGRRYQGQIIEWNDDKRCGFLLPRGSEKNDPVVFIPARALVDRKRMPKVGDVVTYEVIQVAETPDSRRLRTRLRADRLAYPAEEIPMDTQPTGRGLFNFGFTFLLAEAGLIFMHLPYLWIFASTLVMSAISIGQYGWDKNAAKGGRWRVPEFNLQIVALLGGWPGAAIAQQVFRHKTQKRSFQTWFQAAVVLNVVATAGAYYLLWAY